MIPIIQVRNERSNTAERAIGIADKTDKTRYAAKRTHLRPWAASQLQVRPHIIPRSLPTIAGTARLRPTTIQTETGSMTTKSRTANSAKGSLRSEERRV